ncbi:DUF6415 family natural product biosynthesis protein [Streptomyces aquilus]|uniref:DUF6415 family natural product biosynthesis protein n=1 Tax=Streptomyces aquilus TaxID=2548456 RepID=UPI0037D902B0
MAHRTAHPPTTEAQWSEAPPDIATMRSVVNRLLDSDAVADVLPSAPGELQTLTLQLRGHLELLLPEIEEKAVRLPRQSIPRYLALACVDEAREKLHAEPTPRFGGPVGHARRLARTLNAAADHYEALTETRP